MSIFTWLKNQDLPTAAKLQRVWAHCITSRQIRDVGAWPKSSVEGRLMTYGAGAGQASRGIGLTFTESAVDRQGWSLGVALWVNLQLLELGPLLFGVAYESYVNELSAEQIAAMIDAEPKTVLGHRLSTARHLNRAIKHAASQSQNEEIAWRMRAIA